MHRFGWACTTCLGTFVRAQCKVFGSKELRSPRGTPGGAPSARVRVNSYLPCRAFFTPNLLLETTPLFVVRGGQMPTFRTGRGVIALCQRAIGARP